MLVVNMYNAPFPISQSFRKNHLDGKIKFDEDNNTVRGIEVRATPASLFAIVPVISSSSLKNAHNFLVLDTLLGFNFQHQQSKTHVQTS